MKRFFLPIPSGWRNPKRLPIPTHAELVERVAVLMERVASLDANLGCLERQIESIGAAGNRNSLGLSDLTPRLQWWEPEDFVPDGKGSLIPRWRPKPNPATDLDLKMLPIPAGSFLMGSPEDEPGRFDDEGPQHEVTLDAFWMAQTPITQAQWRTVAAWPKVERDLDSDPSYFKGDNRPVERVSWFDAQEFCRRLSQRTGQRYGLPSEAQWEYACRAGSTTPFHFGAMLTPDRANYDGSATCAVASFPVNAWGLHDMHGNVWEWCLDEWHSNYESAPNDGSAREDCSLGESEGCCAAALGATAPGTAARPTATTTSPSLPTASSVSVSVASGVELRLLRGGSWNFSPRFCRSAYRFNYPPDNRDLNFGFRVCCLPQD